MASRTKDSLATDGVIFDKTNIKGGLWFYELNKWGKAKGLNATIV